MEEEKRKLLEALLQAIKAEKYGHGFYKMAAKITDDLKGKKVFEMLAEEELHHMNFLSQHFNSVRETGKLDNSAKLGSRTELSGVSPIFSDDLKARVKDANYEMTSLAIGIQLELDGMNYYRAQSNSSKNSEVKKFFAELAEWESGHYRALLQQQDELKEDYWSAGGFSPF